MQPPGLQVKIGPSQAGQLTAPQPVVGGNVDAPRLAACCPALMRAVGPSVAYRVKVQAIASAASEEAQAAAVQARWLTTAQAAGVLGITANGVRDLLRRGQLDGRRNESRGGAGWC